MRPRFAILFLCGWFLLPLILLLVFVFRGLSPDTTTLRKALDDYRAHERSSSDLLEELPRYFDRFPHIAAIFIRDHKQLLLGSMYEANRMPEGDYRRQVENFRDQRLNPTDSGSSINGYQTFAYHAGERYSIYFYLRPTISFADYWQKQRRQNPYMIWLLSGYLALGLLATVGIYLASARQRQTTEPEKAVFAVKSFSAHPTEVFTALAGRSVSIHPLQVENQIHALLCRLETVCPFSRATYYTLEKNHWQPFLQKRGRLTIRGTSLPAAPEVLEELARRDVWEHPVCNATRDEAILPVRRKGELLGALYLTAAQMLPFAEQDMAIAMQEVSAFAREFFIHRSFSSAALDEETGFFTTPYFLISLKERILSGRPFATALLEIPQIERAASATLQRWARSVSHHVNPPGSAGNNTIARLNPTRLGIIFDFALSEHETDIEHALGISREVQHLTQQILGLEMYGAIVPRLGDLNGMELYLRRLENALLESKARRELRIVTHASPRAVF